VRLCACPGCVLGVVCSLSLVLFLTFDDVCGFAEPFGHRLERGGDDAYGGDGGHEVHIAAPAWDEVCVEVLGHACAGGAALVDADVDALGFEPGFEDVAGEGDKGEQMGAVVWVVVEEAGSWLAQGDKQVPVGVGVAVEEDHARVVAVDDVVVVVSLGRAPVVCEEAWVFGCGLGFVVDGFEVGQAPGRPEGAGW